MWQNGEKMNIPNNLKYAKTHEWVEMIGDKKARVGLTDFAQNAMGGLVFVNLPEEGDEVTAGDSFADVESVKAVSDVNAPMNGTISAVNEELMDAPEKINEDPYGTWMVEISNIDAMEELMDAKEYEAFIREEE
jgi:glycine cleavage system H protein